MSVFGSENKALLDLYAKTYPELAKYVLECEKETGYTKFTYHQMYLTEKYLASPTKIMIVGQENNGWDQFPKLNVNNSSAIYDKFEDLMRGTEKFHIDNGHRRSTFFQFAKKIARDSNDSSFYTLEGLAWTNLLKIASDRGFNGRNESKLLPQKYPALALQYCKQFSDILKQEIAIAQPDILVFLTGPDYDIYLQEVFEGLSYSKFKDFDERLFAVLSHKDLPTKSFRTYHPGYLRRNKLEQLYLNGIVSSI